MASSAALSVPPASLRGPGGVGTLGRTRHRSSPSIDPLQRLTRRRKGFGCRLWTMVRCPAVALQFAFEGAVARSSAAQTACQFPTMSFAMSSLKAVVASSLHDGEVSNGALLR